MDRKKLCSICNETPAAFFCSCTCPPIPICTDCTPQHIRPGGSHYLTPALEELPQKGKGETCDECRNATSVYFCVCSDPPSQFCESHSPAHFLKSTSPFHQKHPISALKIISSGRVKLESFNKRQFYVNNLQAKVNKSLAHLDTFKETCTLEIDKAVQALHDRKARLMTELDEVRKRLTEVFETIEKRRYEVNYKATTWLEHWILDGYLTESSPDMNLFSGSIDVHPVIELIETCPRYTTDIEALLEKHMYLPVLTGNTLRLFDVPPSPIAKVLTLNVPTNINGGTMYCFIDPVTVLCCGGYNQNEVYKVNLESGSAVKMKEMNTIRRHPGIWKLNGYVYLFAGYIDKDQVYLSSAEKFALCTNTWTSLSASLNTRKHACSVSEHASGLFISGVGACNVTSIELFNPTSEFFTLLTLTNPTPPYCPFSLVLGDELFIMFETSLLTARLGAKEIVFTKKEVECVGTGHYLSQSPVVELDGEFFFVWNYGEHQPGGLAKFVPGRSLVELHSFTY